MTNNIIDNVEATKAVAESMITVELTLRKRENGVWGSETTVDIIHDIPAGKRFSDAEMMKTLKNRFHIVEECLPDVTYEWTFYYNEEDDKADEESDSDRDYTCVSYDLYDLFDDMDADEREDYIEEYCDDKERINAFSSWIYRNAKKNGTCGDREWYGSGVCPDYLSDKAAAAIVRSFDSWDSDYEWDIIDGLGHKAGIDRDLYDCDNPDSEFGEPSEAREAYLEAIEKALNIKLL